MRDYGTDKPDLRILPKLAEITDAVKDVEFKVFSAPANEPGGRVCALRVPGGGALTRGELDGYGEYAKTLGAKGLAWIKVNQRARGAEGLQSPIVKNLHARSLATILERTASEDGDVIFFGAGDALTVDAYMGALREQGRPRPRSHGESLAPALGGRASRCSSSTLTAGNGKHATILHQPEGRT